MNEGNTMRENRDGRLRQRNKTLLRNIFFAACVLGLMLLFAIKIFMMYRVTTEYVSGVLLERSIKWGYINKEGQFVIKPRFQKASDFSEGLAAVQVGDKWGYIDKQGRFVISPQFDFTWKFSDGLAWVVVHNKHSWIRR